MVKTTTGLPADGCGCQDHNDSSSSLICSKKDEGKFFGFFLFLYTTFSDETNMKCQSKLTSVGRGIQRVDDKKRISTFVLAVQGGVRCVGRMWVTNCFHGARVLLN